ncbi:phage tail tape measure protein [Craterilacuibacter sinensis]|uniref:Phage tail tape measure protein n=1 Tax=Craterilacuibacter sinensis TaxID=2686017 RepID=A0A845BRZ8_9NEIS|nr:phage tail tape measure protein [Craterilacuibacter sinensis]MXR38004.1 phage tail tape measure protein [Craterilacuibacter sinensis]
MSNIRNLKLEVVLSAIDKATRPIKAVMGSSSGLSKQLKDTKDKLKDLNQAQGSISAFRTLTKDAKAAGETLAAARQKLKEMNAQMAAVGPPTEAMTRKLKSAEIAVEKLTLANRKKIDAAKAAKAALDANGISAAKLGAHERELAAKIDQANAAMERQQDKLAKLSAMQNRQRTARSRYEQSLENRDRIAGAGATTMAAGTAAGLPIVKMVRDYSSYEDAMLGVARQVEGARDANGKLTATYYQMGDAIKAMAEKIPMATTEIAALVEGGARMGIKGKADLLAFAKTAALASTAFDLPADQISEDLGKIANTYKIPIKNIEQLGDVINYLDDNAQSKGADIINVMQRIAGSTGNMNFKEAAALGSTFLSLGASAEVAATATKAMVRELAIAEKQPKRFQAGLKELGLNAKQVQADMAKDSTGTILNVMEAVKKLPEATRMGVMVDLFGKEYGDDAAKLADNLAEYRKQLALVNEAKAKGSMGREGDAKNDTLSAQWQMTQNKLFNQSSELGSTLRQPLMEVMETTGNVLKSVAEWTKANPELTATLVKIAAVLAAVMVAAGGVMLAVAGIIGPFLAARFAMTMFGIQLTSGIGIMGKLGASLGMVGRVIAFVGRLFLLNPIGLVITAIAIGAYLIWRNWDTLGPKFAALWGAIKQAFASGWEWIKTNASGAFNWFLALPGRFMTLGSQIMQGLVNGITTGLGAVKAAITGAGESTIGWFKQKLGIHSPSRVFAELGGFTMEGLQQGITGGQGGPLGAVMNVAKKLTSAGAGIAIGAASGLAGAVTMDTRPPISAMRAPVAASAAQPIQITVNPAPGMSEQQLAMLVAREVERIQRQQAARSRSRLTDKD